MDQILIHSRLRIQRHSVTRVKRYLLGSQFDFKVNVGQEVSPSDVLGESQSQDGKKIFHIAKDLGVSEQEALKYLKPKVGQQIFEGELLAEKEEMMGLKKKVLVSPIDAIVEQYDTASGDLHLHYHSKPTRLISGVYGIVDEINPQEGWVSVKTSASVIYGITGCGKEQEGNIRIIGPKDLLTSTKQLLPDMTREIVVAGSMIFPEGLERAAALGVAGIITGGINAVDLKKLQGGIWNMANRHWIDTPMTIAVIEGFGSAAIGQDIYSVLQEYDRKFAIIDGYHSKIILPSLDQNCMIDIRRTNLPQQVEDSSLQTPLLPLKVGMKVRVVSSPHLGFQGIVEAIDQATSVLPSSFTALMVTVVGDLAKIRVPADNIEALGEI